MCQDITAENWPDLVRRVHTATAAHVRPYTASISRSVDDESGAAHGSGLYLDIKGRPFLLTCEHVVRRGYEGGGRIAHLPRAGGNYHAFPNPWFSECDPVDLAVTAIDATNWSGGDRRALPVSRVAKSYEIAPNELLILSGYPAKAAYFSRFTGEPVLDSPLVPYTARVAALPEGVDSARYFGLQYEMEKAEAADGGKGRLPPAPGFSGSPIWDAGFVAGGCREDWTPEAARVIGVAVRWNEGESFVLAVKAQHVRTFLLENVRRIVANEHWLVRGQPADDAADLEHALNTLKDLE